MTGSKSLASLIDELKHSALMLEAAWRDAAYDRMLSEARITLSLASRCYARTTGLLEALDTFNSSEGPDRKL
jgi:hypothetical protein